MKVAADAEKLRAQGVDVVDFGPGEPDFPTPDNIKQAAIRALDENFTKYTAAGGTAELKAAVCDSHAKDFGTAYSPAECIITVGGKHIIFNLVQALINPGDEVVIPVPYWVTYRDVVNYAGGKCVFVDTDERNGFALTAAMIEPHLTARTRMLIVNSPNNPSGAIIDRGEFEKIYRLTSARGIYLMTDECYCKFLYDSEPFSIASLPGLQGNRAGGGVAVQNLRHDGLAYRLRPRAGAHRYRHDQAAEPQHVQSHLHRPEGRGGSLARSAGIGFHHAGGISPAARFRRPAPARHPRRHLRGTARRLLCLPEPGSGVG